jgi:hypothetical protein
MLLSAVSVSVVAQPNSEIPEGLMIYPVGYMNEADTLVDEYCLNKEETRYFRIFCEKKDIKRPSLLRCKQTYFRFESL